MKSEDESIKMLEMRIQRQLSLSREKNITAQNIQYYVSSATLHREKPQPDASPSEESILNQAVPEQLPNGRKPAAEENEYPRQWDLASGPKAASIEQEPEDYWQKLQTCRAKEAMQRVEIPETTEIQHVKGKNEYEKVLRSINTGALSEIEISLFDGKI